MHKSGFVNIIGRPNAGKSTLMNALVGERMSIITAKPQTTRHRIIGLVSGEDFQIVFSDTPGLIDEPAYKMQEVMNSFVFSTFEDADIMILLLDANEAEFSAEDPTVQILRKLEIPVFIVVNKIDTVDQDRVEALERHWRELGDWTAFLPISALHQVGTDPLMHLVLEHLPQGPPYYPKDQLTDRPERFFVAEIIREQILEHYHQEIPYSVEVDIESFKETTTRSGEPLVRISGMIYTERATQKSILIGKGGESIKRLGTAARQKIETFLDSKVFLELHVKVRDNWRDNEEQLKRFGYR